jgi:SAM-dependent methyltransferase
MTAPQWIDVSQLPFAVLMLLERPHLEWFPQNWPGNELGIALRHNRSVEGAGDCQPATVRQCEIAVMRRICDWIVYVHCPEEYDKQPFLKWNDDELLGLTDPGGKVIADIGSGTGRLLEPLIAAAGTAYAVEPVERLRRYIKSKFSQYSRKLFVLDGLITEIPLPDRTCDLLVSGHVYGDEPEAELREMERATRPGGMVILCPGNADRDNEAHRLLVAHGYRWAKFVEPVDGPRRKYWKVLSGEGTGPEQGG